MLIKHYGKPEAQNITKFNVVETSNLSFWKNAFLNGWEWDTFEFLDKYLDPNKVFIDIGAWIGPISLVASSKSKQCICYEPDEKAYSEFKDNIKLNNINNIILEKLAVSNQSQLTLGANELGTSITSHYTNKFGNANQFTADCITLKDIFTKYNLTENDVSLIKIDVEGHEYELLQDEFLLSLKIPIHVSFHYEFVPDKVAFMRGVKPFFDRRRVDYRIASQNIIELGFDKITH